MLPDFRFALGAVLAITLLAVAGLGLVTSVRLASEAHMRPIEDSRSLAFAGRTEWNQFYDPDGARRFEGLTGKAEIPEARLETPAEIATVTPPAGAEERTASIAPNRADADIADDKTAATNPPLRGEAPAEVTFPAPPAEAAPVPAPDAPGTTESDPPPVDRVASAPTTSPAMGLLMEPQAPTPTEAPAPVQPQAARDPRQDSTIPTPQPRPKVLLRRKIVRAHFRRRVTVASQQQAPPNTSFPWPGYGNPITDAATTKKNTGKLAGTLASRPQ